MSNSSGSLIDSATHPIVLYFTSGVEYIYTHNHALRQ